jgi:hypothetical protein
MAAEVNPAHERSGRASSAWKRATEPFAMPATKWEGESGQKATPQQPPLVATTPSGRKASGVSGAAVRACGAAA